MKTLTTITALILMIIAGMISYTFFTHDAFYLSALFTLISFMMASSWGYLMSNVYDKAVANSL